MNAQPQGSTVNVPQCTPSLIESQHTARCLSYGLGNDPRIIQRTERLTL